MNIKSVFVHTKGIMNKLVKRRYSLTEIDELTSFKINLSNDLATAKRQVLWRVRNFGQLELEVLVGKWAEENISKMGLNELQQFTEEILQKEVVELDGYFLKQREIPENCHLTKQINDFINKR